MFLNFLATLTPKMSWYISRSSGIVSWILLTASMLWGLVLSARILNRHTAPGWLLDLHRYFGGLSLVLTGVHIAGLVGDNWLYIGWSETLVPMASKYRPGAVAWGVVGFYLLIAIEITSFAKKRLPRKVWRATHYLSFPLFVMCTVHGLQAGTDTRVPAYQWGVVVGVSTVMLLLILRIVATRDSSKRSKGRRVANGSAKLAKP